MLFLNGLFWFGVLPVIGLMNGAGGKEGPLWALLLVIGGLIGGVYTQPKLHMWLDPSLKRERGHVGWDDPGSGGGPAGWGGG